MPNVELEKILSELREEHTRVLQAIDAIERLSNGEEPAVKKRGRPPGSRNRPKDTTDSIATGL